MRPLKIDTLFRSLLSMGVRRARLNPPRRAPGAHPLQPYASTGYDAGVRVCACFKYFFRSKKNFNRRTRAHLCHKSFLYKGGMGVRLARAEGVVRAHRAHLCVICAD